ncbi:MAG TPA: glycosyltransferase [Phycisphaerae bacterium]|nr:glycosyltransferase [Phycisphaerae bacterium]HUT59391.1 glycosyltransferase [Phycisphaerae bacterium]
MVLAEAMSLGRACIGSTRGGIPEVIEEGVTGLLCEPVPLELAGAMLRMVESGPLRAKMGEAGRRRAQSLFNVGRQVAEITRELKGVVRRRRGQVGDGRQAGQDAARR